VGVMVETMMFRKGNRRTRERSLVVVIVLGTMCVSREVLDVVCGGLKDTIDARKK
jgi:hypothetical protein